VFWAVVDPEHREVGCDLLELFGGASREMGMCGLAPPP
jgi:hypothetical protein